MRIYPQLSGPRSSQILRDALVLLAVILFGVFAWWVRGAVMSLTAISSGFTDGAENAQDTWDSLGDSLGGIPLLGDEIEGALEGLGAATFGNAAETGATITAAVTTAANVLGFVTFAAPVAVLLVVWLPRRIDRARRWDAAERVLSSVAVSPMFAGAVAGAASGSVPDGAVTGGVPPLIEPGVPGSLPAGSTSAEPGALPAPRPGDTHDTVALPLPSPDDVAGIPGAAARVSGLRAGFRDIRTGPSGEVDVSFPPDELLALRALCNLPLEDLARFTPRPFEAFAAGDYAPLVAALYAHEGLIPPGWSSRS